MSISFEALTGLLTLRTQGWTSGLRSAQSNLQSFAAQAGQQFERVRGVAQGVTIAMGALAASVVAVGASAVKAGADYEQSLSRVKALLGGSTSSAEELAAAMKMLGKQAQEPGKLTVFSDSDAARAMAELAQNGFKAQEIFAAMPGVMSLASAAQVDVAEAADITGKSLRGLSLPVERTTNLIDILAAASTSSAARIPDIAESLKYVRSISHSAGVSVEQLVAYLQVLGNKGLLGSMAGTGVREILDAMAGGGGKVKRIFRELGISAADANGKLKPLPVLMREWNASAERSLTDQQKLEYAMAAFGARGGNAFLSLASDVSEVEQRILNLSDVTGRAASMADTQLDTLKGSWTQLTGSIDTLKNKLSMQLNPTLRAVLDTATSFVNAGMDRWAAQVGVWWQKLIVIIERVGIAFEHVGRVAAPYLAKIRDGMVRAFEAGTSLFERMPPWAKDVTIVVASLLGLSTVLGKLGAGIPIIGPLLMALSAFINPVGLLRGAFELLYGTLGMVLNAFGMLRGGVAVLGPLFTGTAGIISAAWSTVTGSLRTSIVAAGQWAASLQTAGAAATATEPAVVAASTVLWDFGMASEGAAAQTVPLLTALRTLKIEMASTRAAMMGPMAPGGLLGGAGQGVPRLAGPTQRRLPGPAAAGLAVRNTGLTTAGGALALEGTALRTIDVASRDATKSVRILDATFKVAGSSASRTGSTALMLGSAIRNSGVAATASAGAMSVLGKVGQGLSFVGSGIAGWFSKLGSVLKFIATSPLKLLGFGFKALIATLGFLLNPITLVVGAIAGIGAIIGVCIMRSEKARAAFASAFAKIAAGATALVGGALRIFNKFWADNAELMTRIGDKLGTMFGGMVDGTAKAAPTIEKVLGGALKGVLAIVEKLLGGFEALVDILNGDCRRAFVFTNTLAAGLAEAFAKIFDSMADIPILGRAFSSAADHLRRGASDMRLEAAAVQAVLNTEVEQARAAENAKKNAENERQGKERIAQFNRDAAETRIAEQRSYGIVNTPNGIDEQAMTEEQLQQVRDARKKKGQSVFDYEAAFQAQRKKSDLTAKRRESGLPTTSAAGERYRADMEADQKRQADELAAGKKQKAGVENDNPLAAEPAAAETAPPSTESPAIPTSAVAATPAATTAGESSSSDEPAREPIKLLSADEVRSRYVALSSLSRDEALKLHADFTKDLDKALQPDKKTGKVDTDQAEIILANYRRMFAKIPGFSAQAFDEMAAQVRTKLPRLMADAAPNLQQAMIDGIKQTADQGEKIFLTAADQQKQVAESMVQSLMGMTDAQIAVQNRIAQRNAAGFTRSQQDQLATLRQNMIDTAAAATKASGEAKDAAVKAANDAAAAYVKAGQEIRADADKTEKRIAGDARKGATAVRQAAQDEANARKQRLAAQNAPPGQQGGPNAPGGKQGGPGANANDPNQQQPVPQGEKAQRQARIAAANAAFAGGGSPQDIVGQIGTQFGGMLNNAAAIVGTANAQFADAVNQARSPIDKFTMLITQASAKLSMFTINHSDTLLLQAAQQQLKSLENKRKQAIAAEGQARLQGVNASQRAFERMRAQQAQQARQERREAGYDFAGAARVGSNRALPPTNIYISAIDSREAANNIELELRKRGWNKGAKRTLEVRQLPPR